MSESVGIVAAAATRIFSDLCESRVVEAAENGTFPQALWKALEDAGFPAMLASEEHGGVGATVAEAVALLRIAGRFSAPVPIAETMMARWLLSKAHMKVGSGPIALALGTPADPWQLTDSGGRTVLSGRQHAVPWAAAATAIVVLGRSRRGAALTVVSPEKLTIQRKTNIAGEPRDDISADALPVDRMEVLPAPDSELIFRIGALFRAALSTGALERILDMSVKYVTERVQFGRPLSRFQAIQQQLAEFAGAVAASTAITDAAACVVDRDDGELMVAACRARLADAIDTGAAIAHQVHGAIGFAREYPLHQSTRRLWAWRDEYGSSVEWAERLGRAFAGTPADLLWSKLALVGARRGA